MKTKLIYLVLLTLAAAAPARAESLSPAQLAALKKTCTPCSSCGTKVAGEWRYILNNRNNQMIRNGNVTFTQSGDAFEGDIGQDSFVGKVQGNWVKLTMTVNGEWPEGYVAYAEGSRFIRQGRTYIVLAVVSDTFGSDNSNVGSIVFVPR